MKFQKNVRLKNYTAFKIGGRAKYFFAAKTKEDLIKAVNAAKEAKLPFFILAGGSNVLVSDKSFNGLVINLQFSFFEFKNSEVLAEAGVPLGKLVNFSAKKGLSGLEWAAAIPGTVGGAVFGNAGAFKKSMADIVSRVEMFDFKNSKVRILKNRDCKFSYRSSIFKSKKNLLILSVFLKLKKGSKENIEKKAKEYFNYKKRNHPWNYPSAGSVFKNPPGFSAGELIEKCGLKGKKIGKAKISEKHTNFIVNLGGAKAEDVKKLISLAKKSVKNKFKINLEEEIQFF